MIKKIHYCWLGGSLPDGVRRQIDEWVELCPSYEFIESNDSNVDYPEFNYWNRMIAERRYGFASDVVRFSKIYEEGGFYMDCDVVLKKSWDELNVPEDHLVMGYMYDYAISGGVFYAPPKHPLVGKLLDYYKDISPSYYPVSNTIITHCINNNVDDFLLNGRYYSSEKYKLTIFPKEFLCQPSFIRSKPFAVDQFAGSWRNAGKSFKANRGEFSTLRIIRRKLGMLKSLRKSEFRSIYINALLGKKKLCVEHWRSQYGMKGGAINPN